MADARYQGNLIAQLNKLASNFGLAAKGEYKEAKTSAACAEPHVRFFSEDRFSLFIFGELLKKYVGENNLFFIQKGELHGFGIQKLPDATAAINKYLSKLQDLCSSFKSNYRRDQLDGEQREAWINALEKEGLVTTNNGKHYFNAEFIKRLGNPDDRFVNEVLTYGFQAMIDGYLKMDTQVSFPPLHNPKEVSDYFHSFPIPRDLAVVFSELVQHAYPNKYIKFLNDEYKLLLDKQAVSEKIKQRAELEQQLKFLNEFDKQMASLRKEAFEAYKLYLAITPQTPPEVKQQIEKKCGEIEKRIAGLHAELENERSGIPLQDRIKTLDMEIHILEERIKKTEESVQKYRKDDGAATTVTITRKCM